MGAGDRPRRRARRRAQPPAVVLSEMQGRRTPGRGWIESVLARRPTGVIAVFSDLNESMREPAPHPRHPVRGCRPDRRTAPRHAVGRRHELERRPDRDPPPPRARSPADRRHRRTGGHPVQPCPGRRLPRGDGRGRRRDRPGAHQPRPFQVEEGIASRSRLLPVGDRPTAIITGNDLQALGVYQAAREPRLHIPEDLSVVGFDDLPVARWVSPPLTTIRQPLVEMAETAAELVLAHRPRRAADPDPRRAGDRAHRPREHGAAEPLTRRSISQRRAALSGSSGVALGQSAGGLSAIRCAIVPMICQAMSGCSAR